MVLDVEHQGGDVEADRLHELAQAGVAGGRGKAQREAGEVGRREIGRGRDGAGVAARTEVCEHGVPEMTDSAL